MPKEVPLATSIHNTQWINYSSLLKYYDIWSSAFPFSFFTLSLTRSFSGYTRKLSQRVVLDGRRDIHIYQKQMYWMKTKNASCRTDSFYHFLLWLKKSSKVVDSSISCSASHPQKKQTISCMKFMTNSHSSGAQSSRSRCKVNGGDAQCCKAEGCREKFEVEWL